ncbi:hypothetical protein [Zavarzinia sp.]|uniref:hypothetical protein n=1 Tax=Zavarzinia sp. TaxID=2027920 RepID=UPI0035681A4B
MLDLHPNLGRPATGTRKWVYRLSLLLTLAFAGGAYLLVAAGIIPGTPIDVWSSWVILGVLFVPFMALMDGAGAKRSRLEKWSEFGFVWLLVSGIAQTFWELPWFFLDLTGLVHNIGPDDGYLWAWWVYGGADTRYITSNPTIAGLEFMAGFSGPFELAAWYLYKYGRGLQDKIKACWMALIIGVGLTYMTGVFFVAEWHVGWVHIQQGGLGFWLKFVGLNVPWIVAPAIAIPAAMLELAHLYRVQGFEAAMRAGAGDQAARPARAA